MVLPTQLHAAELRAERAPIGAGDRVHGDIDAPLTETSSSSAATAVAAAASDEQRQVASRPGKVGGGGSGKAGEGGLQVDWGSLLDGSRVLELLYRLRVRFSHGILVVR